MAFYLLSTQWGNWLVINWIHRSLSHEESLFFWISVDFWMQEDLLLVHFLQICTEFVQCWIIAIRKFSKAILKACKLFLFIYIFLYTLKYAAFICTKDCVVKNHFPQVVFHEVNHKVSEIFFSSFLDILLTNIFSFLLVISQFWYISIH